MAHMNEFEALPPEIHVQIMLDLGNLKELYDLIRASPRLLHVFGASKALILQDFALNTFHPSVQIDALSIARLSKLPHPIPREVAIELLTFPIHERWDLLISVMDVARSVALCKLSNLFEFFIKDYCRNILPVLERQGEMVATDYVGYPCDTPPRPRLELSWTEHARLQRGFSRFELYCRIFGQCKPVPGLRHDPSDENTLPAWEQARLFLLQHEASEIVEIHCVRDYLEWRLSQAFEDVEDHAVKAPRPEYVIVGYPGDGVKGCPIPFQYHGRYDLEGIIEHLTSLGLGYVRRIFEAEDDEEKTDLMLHGCDARRHFRDTDFLSAALDLGPAAKHEALEDYQGIRGAWSDGLAERLRLPLASGWLWFCDGDYSGQPLNPHCQDLRGVRDLGYVFWDYERLDEALIFAQDPRAVARSSFHGRHMLYRWDIKSVQERFMGPERDVEESAERLRDVYLQLQEADNDSEEEFEERDRLRYKRL